MQAYSPNPRMQPPRPDGAGDGLVGRLRGWAFALKRDAILLWLAGRDPRVPWWPKLLSVAIAAYAFSPIDLIPDAIPVLGLLDEMILLPGLVWLTLRMIPTMVRSALRLEAERLALKPVSRAGAAGILAFWGLCLLLTAWWLFG